ncbi:MAG: DEAD/DEAH box helicase [Candidatus Pacearchaeota archaeon]
MESFRKLGLSEQLLRLLEKAGINKPSEIQEKVIPLVIGGKDVIGGSATGSGKTLAFGAGIIEKIELGKGSQVLVMTPTRELAEQVGNVFLRFSSHKRLNVAVVYGGVGIEGQIRALKNSEIIVGTPGRILDHIERRTINLSHLRVLVLDEADRMLDMGFIHDVEKIIKHCPKERQTLLFSATISEEIEHIANKHMRNPMAIAVESYVNPEKLKQIYYDIQKNLKFSLLVHLLKNEKYGLVMVFCNTRRNTDFVANNLKRAGVNSVAIHGGLKQNKRNNIMEKFSGNSVYVLVCTDIAARGLDIKGISHVYNYDIPKTSQDYVHRIGRTARAGKDGIAINLVSERDYENFSNVLRDPSLNIEMIDAPDVEMVNIKLDERRHDNRRDYEDRREYSRGKISGHRGDRREGRDERIGGNRRNNSRGSRNSFRGNQSRGRRY